jgi:hypothetical protein
MTTVAELVRDALIEVGSITPDETLTANESDHAIRVLNRMIQQWNAEGIMVYTMDRQTFSLVNGQQMYTIGPGGDFPVARPVVIEMVSVQNSALPKPVEIPVHLMTDHEWRGVTVKNTPGVFPTQMWATGNVPLNQLYFWPVPGDSDYDVVLYTWGQTAAYTSVTSTVTFPPAYEEAIVSNLSLRLITSYGRTADPLLMQRAFRSKELIASINNEPLYAHTDLGLGNPNTGSKAIQSFGIVID